MSIWKDRRVLVTGHTGFKGAWLCHWLLRRGAQVVGYSLEPSTDPSLFRALDLSQRMPQRLADIRDLKALQAFMAESAPEVVFHLAAQPLVLPSYEDPAGTWASNVMGTIHVLESLRRTPSARVCVVVTSDKCYENREWAWAYRESDPLGGSDPYSSSKAAAELACASWRRSFFAGEGDCRIATARAGNVIGGGDWSRDRIVPDFVQSSLAGKSLAVRSPGSVRPWQHVLEPLSGYIRLAEVLWGPGGRDFAEAWNFGPLDAGATTVGELVAMLHGAWGGSAAPSRGSAPIRHEAGMLKLDSGKARSRLAWVERWDLATTVARTVEWYRGFAAGTPAIRLVDSDLDAYEQRGSAVP